MQNLGKSAVLEAVHNVRLVIANSNKFEIDYILAKHANEEHHRWRGVVREKIADLRAWEHQYGQERDLIGIFGGSVDGGFLLAQVKLAFETYRSVSKASILVYRQYLKQCRG